MAAVQLEFQKADLRAPQFENRKRDSESRTPKVGVQPAAADDVCGTQADYGIGRIDTDTDSDPDADKP
jgi:hypothetical protein